MAQDLIREPMEQAREYMQQAIDAEEAGQDGSEYVRMVDEVLRKPLEQVKEMVESFDFDSPSVSGDESGSAREGTTAAALDLEGAREELEAFREEAAEPVALSASASGITSAARSAYNSVKNLFSAPIPIRAAVQAVTEGGEEEDGTAEEATVKMSSGGRFSKLRQSVSSD